MNCKPADMAVIVFNDSWNALDIEEGKHIIGCIVVVTKLCFAPTGLPAWQFVGSLFSKDGEPINLLCDAILKPIEPPPILLPFVTVKQPRCVVEIYQLI